MDRITTPFGFRSTADEVLHGVNLDGKHAIVTGGASGIGVDTAQALAKVGAAVTLAVRNLEAGKAVAQRITHATGNHEVFVRPLDLADQQSIAAFVASWEGRAVDFQGHGDDRLSYPFTERFRGRKGAIQPADLLRSEGQDSKQHSPSEPGMGGSKDGPRTGFHDP